MKSGTYYLTIVRDISILIWRSNLTHFDFYYYIQDPSLLHFHWEIQGNYWCNWTYESSYHSGLGQGDDSIMAAFYLGRNLWSPRIYF